LSVARIASTDQRNQIGKRMKAVLILSFQKEANARAVAVVTNGIHGIQKIIGSALTGKGKTMILNEVKEENGLHYTYSPYHEIVNIRLSPKEYEYLEQLHGFGSVQTFIENMVHDYIYHKDERSVLQNDDY